MIETLRTQAETNKTSLDTVARELQTAKRQQECFQTASQKAKESERRRIDSQSVKIGECLDKLQKTEKEAEDSLSRKRMLDDARITIKTSDSHRDHPDDAGQPLPPPNQPTSPNRRPVKQARILE